SSDNAATYGKYMFESVAAIVTALAAPSLVTRYDAAPAFGRGAVIGISQSGASPDVAAVVREGRRAGAVTIALTNSPRSRLARTAEHVFALRAGRERAVAATKTYTATCVALALLAAATAEARGRSALSLAGLPEAVDDAVLLRAPLSETLTPVSFVIAAQLLAVALARRRGRDPERPAGLSKVTRTC